MINKVFVIEISPNIVEDDAILMGNEIAKLLINNVFVISLRKRGGIPNEGCGIPFAMCSYGTFYEILSDLRTEISQ